MAEFPPGVRIDLWAREWNGTGWDEAKLGSGPLPVMSARYEEAVDELGSFEFTMPAEHRMAPLLKPSDEVPGARYVRIYVGNEGWVFLGEITHVETDISPRGGVVTVTGWSSARELTRLKTGYGWTVVDETMADAVDALLAGTEWSAGTIDSAVVATYAHEFNGLTRLEALRKVAEVQGFLLRFDSTTREVHMGAMGTNPNGVRFQGMEGPVSPRFMAERTGEVIPIAHIRQTYESEAVVNKVRAVAQLQGIDGDDLTMAESNMSSPYTRHSETGPDGRTIHFLRDDASTAKHGPNEEDLVVREIRILGTGASDRQRAANTLYGVASTYLQRHKEPLTQYAVAPAGLKHRAGGVDLAPVGGRYPVQFRGWVQEKAKRRVWVEVDAEPWLMARSRSIDASGQSAWELTWSTVPRRIPEDGEAVAEVLQEFRSAIAARIPTVTWGGNPPVGRLAEEGLQLISPDDLGIGVNLPRKISWYVQPDFTQLLAELAAQFEGGDDGMGGFITSSSYMRQMLAMAPSRDGLYQLGFYDYANSRFDTSLHLTPGDGGMSIWPVSFLTHLVGDTNPRTIMHIARTGLTEWNLFRHKDGEMVPIGGSMRATGKGPYGVSVAAVGSTYLQTTHPAPEGQVATYSAFQATVYTGGSSWAMNMPGGGGDGFYVAFVTRLANSGSFNTPGGWTQLGTVGSATSPVRQMQICWFQGNASSSYSWSSNVSSACIAHIYRFPNEAYSLITHAMSGANGAADPPNVSNGGLATPVKWFAAASQTATPSAAPANYADLNNNITGQLSLSTAWRNTSATAENPGTFAGVSGSYVAGTVGIGSWPGWPRALITAISATAAGEVEIGVGNSGAQITRGKVEIIAANTRAELVVPIEIPLGGKVWVRRPGGGSATVRLEIVDDADLV